ncbi:MAG: class B sortase [Lachnospiraceae bacterium]|nr:class B sortase [Lachnospiraceae bacterium]
MTADDLTVEGRRFRTQSDYEAALRDSKKIERIKAETDLNSPKQIYELFNELQSGIYRFESALGTDFDDEIYAKVEKLRASGITPENATDKIKIKEKSTDKKKTSNKTKKSSKNSAKKKKIRLEDYDRDMQVQILLELDKREKRRKFIIIMASLIAVLCFGYFGGYYFFAEKTSVDYEDLAELKGSDALSANAQKKNEFAIHKEGIKLPDVLDEYKTLYEKNKRLIGWLKIDDTNIDYPVMQTSNNEYYLDHNFNQEYDKNGSIFMDYACSAYPKSTNLILYGHHMKSGNMFGNLQKYAKESYGKEHALIQFDTIYEKATYQVMYVFRSQVYNEDDIVFKYYQFIEANSEAEFDSYMNEMSKMSLYDTGVTAKYGDSLLTLSTCDHSQEDGRFVVVAKRVG